MATDATPYLFLLKEPSTGARVEAAEWLRELGATVVAEFGDEAIEATVSREQARAATESDRFSAQLKSAMLAKHLERLRPEQRGVVELWNARFTPEYRELARDRSKIGRSWGDPEHAPPLPYTALDPEDFKQLLAEYEEETGERLLEEGEKDSEPLEPLEGDSFVEFERKLTEAYDDPTVAYHLARLGARLGPEHRKLLLRIPKDLLEVIVDRFFLPEASCWKMSGRMAVGIVFVESSRRGGPTFSTTERNQICQRILAGQAWLTSEHPSGNLAWAYDIQQVKIDVADGSGDPNEDYWRDPGMARVRYRGNGYDGSWNGVAAYREDMRRANHAAHALVVFVTPYANRWHAYAGGGRVTLARHNNWGHWGLSAIDMITAHETSHLFGAADEYTGSGTPCSSCRTLHGCDRVPNGNCGACAKPQQDCVMDMNARRICAYTRGQIGWSDLFVETTTADDWLAGTDDDVWIDIGERAFTLDTPSWDDRERGHREAYAIWAPGLAADDVKRVLIRKSRDGFFGGWKLERVRVWVHGESVCESAVNRWLEDDHRWWVGCVADGALVNDLRIEVATSDVAWAGTDDDVTATIAARDWDLDNQSHDDFERGHTDSFSLDPSTGLRVADVHSLRIHKSPDGFAGGWKLHGVKLIVNGSPVFEDSSINKWLEDDHRTWAAVF